MATIYFLRDGYGDDDRMVKQKNISSDSASQLFNHFHTHFNPREWVLNGDKPVNPASNPSHVVLKIEQNDICEKFPNKGFYLIDNISPRICLDILSQK